MIDIKWIRKIVQKEINTKWMDSDFCFVYYGTQMTKYDCVLNYYYLYYHNLDHLLWGEEDSSKVDSSTRAC